MNVPTRPGNSLH